MGFVTFEEIMETIAREQADAGKKDKKDSPNFTEGKKSNRQSGGFLVLELKQGRRSCG